MKIRLYHKDNIDTIFFQNIRKSINDEINKKSEEYLLNVNVNDYASYFENRFLIDFPIIHEDKKTVESYEALVSGQYFPYDFDVRKEDKINKRIVRYIIPYTGNLKILEYTPSKIYNSCIGFEIDEMFEEIYIEIIDFYGDPNLIKERYNSEINNIYNNYHYLKSECDNFNYDLKTYVINIINLRKQKINANYSFLNSLGVPLKRNENTPDTFSVPTPKLRKKIIVEPKTQTKKKLEPALNLDIYYDILKTINDIGKNFERMPSVYKNKNEESLRDHILMIVDPNFQLGNATGETFNKKGKTDIILMYDSNVVFIAECKFWKGEKQYLESIDQLLGYLTWRNSKTALIVFVKNSDISNVICTIKDSTIKHKNYLREDKASGESWFNYRFHLNDDEKREINVAVMVYHIPK